MCGQMKVKSLWPATRLNCRWPLLVSVKCIGNIEIRANQGEEAAGLWTGLHPADPVAVKDH